MGRGGGGLGRKQVIKNWNGLSNSCTIKKQFFILRDVHISVVPGTAHGDVQIVLRIFCTPSGAETL